MLRTVQEAQEKQEKFFDQIYQLAQAEDKEALIALLKDPQVSIDVLKKGSYETPAEKLAAEGNKKAAEFLRIHGASIKGIARGVGRKGDKEYAHELLALDPDCLNDIAFGAAQADPIEYAENLRLNKKASATELARAAAYSGNRGYAESLRKQYDVDATQIAAAAAEGGQNDYANYLLQQHSARADEVALGAAKGGNFEYVKELQKQHAIPKGLIAMGCAQAGYFIEAERLLSQDPNPNYDLLASLAARRGYFDYAEHLCREYDCPISTLEEGAAQGGYLNYKKSTNKPVPLEKKTISDRFRSIIHRINRYLFKNTQPPSLFNIDKEIASQLEDKKIAPLLNDRDKGDLNEIRARIEMLDINQSAIFLAHKEYKKNDLTQPDLNKSSRAVHLAKVNHLYLELQKLMNDITTPEGIYYRTAQRHPTFFKNIKQSLKKLIDNLANDRDRKHGKLTSSSEEKNSLWLHVSAQIMGGRYLDFKQSLDPIKEKNEGDCYGYFRSWVEQITSGNTQADFLRPYRETHASQLNQFLIKREEIFKERVSLNFSVFEFPDIESTLKIDSMLKKLQDKKIYGLNLKGERSHRIGLRKIEATQEIECFDPNVGVFTFKTEQAFKIWFRDLLSRYNYSAIKLYDVGDQPSKSTSFVPETTKTTLSLFLPVIKPGDGDNTVKIKIDNYHHIRLTGIAKLLGRPIADNEQKINEKFEHQQTSYQAYLKEKFFKEDAIIIKKYDVKQDGLKEFLVKQLAIGAHSNELLAFLNLLKHNIMTSSSIVSLEGLITYLLTEKLPSQNMTWAESLAKDDRSFLSDLQNNFEISPILLTLLQQQLLLEIMKQAESLDLKNLKKIKTILKKYLEGTVSLTNVFDELKQVDPNPQISLFSKYLPRPGKAENSFYSLIDQINPNNPSSLQSIYSKMEKLSSKKSPRIGSSVSPSRS